MKKLMLLRLMTGLQYAGALLALCALMFIIQVPHLSGYIIFAALFLPLLGIRSSWYLNLPYGRRVIAGYVALESVVFWAIGFGSTKLVGFALEQTGRTTDISPEFKELYLVAGLIILFSTLGMPIRQLNANATFTNLDFRYYFKLLNRVKYQLAATAVLLVVWYCFLAKAPLTYIGLTVFLFALAPIKFLKAILYPQEGLRRLAGIARIAAGVTFVLLPFAAFTVLNAVPPGRATETAFMTLLGLPYKLSEPRRLELARSSQSTLWRELKNLSEESRAKISLEEWTARTAACESSSCLDLSDSLIPKTEKEDLNRFAALIAHCEPEVRREGEVACGKIRPGRPTLERWYGVLRRSPEINQWLQSENTTKRFIAIKALVAPDAPADALAILRAQRDGADRMLASVAGSTLEYHSGVGKWSPHCEDEKLEGDAKAFCNRLKDGDWNKRD